MDFRTIPLVFDTPLSFCCFALSMSTLRPSFVSNVNDRCPAVQFRVLVLEGDPPLRSNAPAEAMPYLVAPIRPMPIWPLFAVVFL